MIHYRVVTAKVRAEPHLAAARNPVSDQCSRPPRIVTARRPRNLGRRADDYRLRSRMAAAAPVPGSYLTGRGKAGDVMAASHPGGRRLPCPCSSRRVLTARTRIFSVLALAGLVAMAVLGLSGTPVRAQPAASSAGLPPGHGGSSAARVLLIAVALVALGAFAVLQLLARSQRRRWSVGADWRTWPPGYDPWADARRPGDRAARRLGVPAGIRISARSRAGRAARAERRRAAGAPAHRVGSAHGCRAGGAHGCRAGGAHGVGPEARIGRDDRRQRPWDA